MTDFNRFFAPRSLAFLGASTDTKKWGFRILANVLTGGFQGKIYPVNPRGGEVLGLKIYSSIAEIPEVPDLAIIVVPPTAMVETIKECVAKGIKAGVVVTAGFAEVGSDGRRCRKRSCVWQGRAASGWSVPTASVYSVRRPNFTPRCRPSSRRMDRWRSSPRAETWD